MDNFWKDVRHGVRLLIKSPALTVVAVLALTAGIGLTTTMFSIVYGALFRGLPFEEPKQIIHLERSNLQEGQNSLEVPIHDLLDWRLQQRSFEGLAGFYTGTVNVSGVERAERYDGAFMSANTFSLLRVRPVLGRVFREGEDHPSAEAVLLIGYDLWQTRFDGDPNVIGKTIRANGEPMSVIGVLPEDFRFPFQQQIWLPLRIDPLKLKRGEGRSLEVMGRLRDGVTLDQAAIEMAAIGQRLEQAYPESNQNIRPVLQPFTDEYIGAEPRTMLFTMLGAVFFVLLIACTNVANLLLGRAILRSKEVGIRAALGASRWRLVTQFLTEALVISFAGAVLGTGVAYVGIRLFNDSIAASQPPSWIVIQLDSVALLFVLVLTLITSAFAGTIPALQASRSQLTDVLKDESRGSSSFRLGRISRALVVFEIALSCGLLVAAGLTIKSVVKLRTVNLGFDSNNLFTSRIGLDEARYPANEQVVRFFDELQPRLAALPGAQSVTLASSLPGLGEGSWTFAVEGQTYERGNDYPVAARTAIGDNYFATLGVQLLEGRSFTAQDRAGALPVALVNQSFARRFFPEVGAIGRRVRLGDSKSTNPWLTIVGLVPDAMPGELGEEDQREAMYVPFAQNPQRFVSVIARTRGEPLGITSAVRETVAGVDKDMPIYFVNTLREAIAVETWFYRVFGVLFMIFGFVALLLAAIGLYAVMAFSVSQRTREVGIRMAIGAQTRDVLRMILKQGLIQVSIGIGIGLVIAFFAAKGLALILFDVQPNDVTVFGAIVLVLTATAFLACLIPARRATLVHPLEALRYE
ncbi:MAG: ABC transporter permease [Gemmatimonadota bacterium]